MGPSGHVLIIMDLIRSLSKSSLEQLREAIFTKLYLQITYNLCMRQGDKWKAAYSMTSGHYEYLVMPYVLSLAKSIIQSLINDCKTCWGAS